MDPITRARINDGMRDTLAEVLGRDVQDPRVAGVTVTGVQVTQDLAYAKVFFTCLERAHVPEAEAGLRRATGFLRSQLGRRIKIWTTPELRFVYDESIERGDRLSRLIDRANSESSTKPTDPAEG